MRWCAWCVCVACMHSSASASAAGWAPQPVSAPALVANGALLSVSCGSRAPCVAVGYFLSPSGSDRPLIEIRKGREWSIQASPAPSGGGDAQLNAVVCPGSRTCVAVGYSESDSGAKVPLAERWNGSSWSIQRTIDPRGAGGELSALACRSAGFCMAVGSSSRGALIERWTGSRWSLDRAASSGAASRLDGVSCSSRASCVAVGSARRGAVAELWSGRRWSRFRSLRFRSPRGAAELTAVSCTSRQACSAISDTEQGYAVQRWNGRRWKAEQVHAPACDSGGNGPCGDILSSITCVSASTCHLAGALDFPADGSSGGDQTLPLVASWNGSGWRAERVRDPADCLLGDVCGTSLNGISCTARSACITVGTYSNSVNGQTAPGQPLIERRDAGAWFVQRTPVPLGPAPSGLSAVSCSSATACAAVGSYTGANGRTLPLAERWNGVTWTIQPTPGTGPFSSVSCASSTMCIAVGAEDFATYPPTPVMLTERWNGTTWTPMQTSGAALSAVSCTSTTACVAVGSRGTSPVTELWNAATWTDGPSTGVNGWSSLSCGSANACVAAGLTTDGRITADSWNGTSWTPLPPLPFDPGEPGLGSPPAVSCSAANACTIVGDNDTGLVYRWNGAAWSQQSIQLPAGENVGSLDSVACPSAIACTAVGFVTISTPHEDLQDLLLERWDGRRWSTEPSPFQAGALPGLSSVSCASTTTCTAVGGREPNMPNGNATGTSEGGSSVPYVLSGP
jgi:hypothetical protein